MDKKQYLIFRTVTYAVLSVFIFSIPLWAEMEDKTFGISFALILGAFFAYRAFRTYKRIASTHENERAYAPPVDASYEVQIKFYKRYLLLTYIAFPILTIMIYYDLAPLESGDSDSALLWAPVSYMYEQFGFWPAILFTPIMGVLVVMGFFYKINKIKEAEREEHFQNKQA